MSDQDHVVILRYFPPPLELVFGVHVKICGDGKKVQGPCLLIMNHRTRFDWMFLWCYLLRMGDLYKLKIVLKESIKKIPVLGNSWHIKIVCMYLSFPFPPYRLDTAIFVVYFCFP